MNFKFARPNCLCFHDFHDYLFYYFVMFFLLMFCFFWHTLANDWVDHSDYTSYPYWLKTVYDLVEQFFPQFLHWPLGLQLKVLRFRCWGRVFATGNCFNCWIAFALFLFFKEIGRWFFCPISVFTAMLSALSLSLSGSTVSQRNSSLISLSNVFVIFMSRIMVPSRFKKLKFTASAFRLL